MANYHPEAAYENQADYLNQHTDLTRKEAEVYLRWYLAEDSVSQRELASQMDVTEGTFSKHLSNAKEKLGQDEATISVLKNLLAVTPVGGIEKTRNVLAADSVSHNVFALLTVDEFLDENRPTAKYKLHLVYREDGSDHLREDAPEDIIHYEKWTTFTIEGENDSHLAQSVSYYLDTISAIDEMTKFNVFKLLSDSGLNVETQKKTVLKEIKDKK